MSVDIGLPIPWVPDAQNVASLLRARTKDSNGTETGTWSADTRPTLIEVNALIDLAVNEMTSAVGGAAVPDACVKGAQSTAALLTAMYVELSYFPEQVRADRSAYSEYKELYDKQLALLQECVNAGGAGADVGGVGTGFHNVPVIPATTYRYASSGAPPELAAWSLRGPWGDMGGDYWPEPENPANWRNPFQPPREPPLPEDLPVGNLPASGEELP